jgi:Tol biopolymer transport system component
VHDLEQASLVRASVDLLGGNPDGASTRPRLSDDGLRVVFESEATDLVAGDTKGHLDIFLRDLALQVTVRASLADSGAEPSADCELTSISADGWRVAFESEAANLVPGDTNGLRDVFVRDLQQGWTRRVSVSSLGVQADQACFAAALSADGRHVAFYSASTLLAPGDTNGKEDVFVHHLDTGLTELVSLAWDGAIGSGPSALAALSGDGSRVLFRSSADNLLPGDTNGVPDIFQRDLSTGTVELVSKTMGGGFPDKTSLDPSISPDGRYLMFLSYADDLVPGDTNLTTDLFLRDAQTGTLERVNLTSQGLPMSGSIDVSSGVLSADGRAVAFSSFSGSVVPWDLNSKRDVFLRERWGAVTTVESYCTPSTTSLVGCEAVLAGVGVPSMAGAAAFQIDSGPVLGGSLGLLFLGRQGPAQKPFGTQGGFDCIAQQHFRAPVKLTGGTQGACDGSMVYTLAELAAAHPSIVLAGVSLHTQIWLRDPANPDGFATSSGVWFQILP